jgi:NAD(P)H-flavin reductase
MQHHIIKSLAVLALGAMLLTNPVKAQENNYTITMENLPIEMEDGAQVWLMSWQLQKGLDTVEVNDWQCTFRGHTDTAFMGWITDLYNIHLPVVVEPGMEVTVRGPYGRPFPVEDDLKGRGLLFIAGGIGLAPLRSVINYVRDKRENYGDVQIVYGARSKDDLVDYTEILDEWSVTPGFTVNLTIDREQEGWDGHVAFVPTYVEELGFDPNKTVLVCGPPIMIKFVLQALTKLGFEKKQVYTTMELRMKCGLGKCGRCNIGDKYVCKDGPVFRFDELDELPSEY